MYVSYFTEQATLPTNQYGIDAFMHARARALELLYYVIARSVLMLQKMKPINNTVILRTLQKMAQRVYFVQHCICQSLTTFTLPEAVGGTQQQPASPTATCPVGWMTTTAG